jgi:hypothetical protein
LSDTAFTPDGEKQNARIVEMIVGIIISANGVEQISEIVFGARPVAGAT